MNPRDAKVDLAKRIIKDFHSAKAADEAEQNFVNQFSKGQMPDEIDEISVDSQTYKIVDLLLQTNLTASKGEAKRIMEQGGVKIDGEKIPDTSAEIEVGKEKSFVIQVGKRKFLKVTGNWFVIESIEVFITFMRKTIIILLSILFCCSFNTFAQQEIDSQEYEVYKAWLEKAFITSDTKQIFILNFTSYEDLKFSLGSSDKKLLFSQLQSSTRKDYKLRNRKSFEMKDNFRVNPVVNIINDEERGNYLGSDSPYPDLAKKFGAEYRISFSRVGFNKKKNQALVNINYKSNTIPKYMFGYLYLLSKENGEWIIKQRMKSWEY